jgi:hypothetical protein
VPVQKQAYSPDAADGALWKAKLRMPIGLAAGGALIAALDRAVGWAIGERIMLGPVRLFWLAAAMALIGVCLSLWRVFWPSSD